MRTDSSPPVPICLLPHRCPLTLSNFWLTSELLANCKCHVLSLDHKFLLFWNIYEFLRDSNIFCFKYWVKFTGLPKMLVSLLRQLDNSLVTISCCCNLSYQSNFSRFDFPSYAKRDSMYVHSMTDRTTLQQSEKPEKKWKSIERWRL